MQKLSGEAKMTDAWAGSCSDQHPHCWSLTPGLRGLPESSWKMKLEDTLILEQLTKSCVFFSNYTFSMNFQKSLCVFGFQTIFAANQPVLSFWFSSTFCIISTHFFEVQEKSQAWVRQHGQRVGTLVKIKPNSNCCDCTPVVVYMWMHLFNV